MHYHIPADADLAPEFVSLQLVLASHYSRIASKLREHELRATGEFLLALAEEDNQ